MARPTEFEEPTTARICVRLTPTQRKDLEQVARDNGTDITGVIREAVNEYVADYQDRPVFRHTEPDPTP